MLACIAGETLGVFAGALCVVGWQCQVWFPRPTGRLGTVSCVHAMLVEAVAAVHASSQGGIV